VVLYLIVGFNVFQGNCPGILFQGNTALSTHSWRFYMTDKKMTLKPIAAAIGVAFVSSIAFSSTAIADENPFAMTDLETGYMLADRHGDGEEGKCGEGKCGEDKGEDGKCGEGKCGEDKGEEGKCGEDKGEEGSCGEDKGEEGSCGGDRG
jgi:uncharacterized low-complexity protein